MRVSTSGSARPTGHVRALAAATVPAGAVLATLLAAGTAAADIDGSSPEPDSPVLGTGVSVTFSGPAAPAPGQAPSDPPPPLCWWVPAGADAANPTAFAERFHEVARSYGTADMVERQYLQLPEGSTSLDDAIAAEAALGQPGVTWYTLMWDSTRMGGDDYYGALQEAGCTAVRPWRGDSQVAVVYDSFAPGQQPAPRVDVEELARYAYRAMVLVPPRLEWNPKARDHGDAALVNLPTWVWAEDPAAVADRWIQASIGDVWARVDATPTGMTVTADGQRVECTPAQARRAYAVRRDEESACTVTFTRASHGSGEGFAVDAAVRWEAAWTSSTGEGGTFDTRTIEETTSLPVASVQSLVTQVD